MAEEGLDEGTSELRAATRELRSAISFIRTNNGIWQIPPSSQEVVESWNFTTFKVYIDQRFSDLSLQLRERYEAQQTGLAAALAAAEKAVNAALIAAEKAVDKAEGAQQLRNEAQNEFRKSLSDLSGLMWTIKEGTLAVDSIRREFTAHQSTTDDRITQLSQARVEATDSLRRSVEARIGALETGHANMLGRIWAISALFAALTLLATLGFRFVGPATPPVQPVVPMVPAPTATPNGLTLPAPVTVPR